MNWFKDFLALKVVPILLRLFLKFVYYTNRRVWIFSDQIKNEPAIYICWHGNLLMQPFFKAKHIHRGDVYMINSDHRDAEIMLKTLSGFNLKSIRGSTRKGGLKALIEALQHVKEGSSIAITIDGPKGPRYTVTNGVVALSQKGDVPIITQNVIPSKYWRLKTWDKLIIPKPFGTLTFISGEPFKVTGMEMDDAKELVRKRLMEHEI